MNITGCRVWNLCGSTLVSLPCRREGTPHAHLLLCESIRALSCCLQYLTAPPLSPLQLSVNPQPCPAPPPSLPALAPHVKALRATIPRPAPYTPPPCHPTLAAVCACCKLGLNARVSHDIRLSNPHHTVMNAAWSGLTCPALPCTGAPAVGVACFDLCVLCAWHGIPCKGQQCGHFSCAQLFSHDHGYHA